METPDFCERMRAAGARIEPATKRHARMLGRTMRAQDIEEGRVGGNFAPEAAVRMSINNSKEAWAAYAGDDLLCAFGAGPMNDVPAITIAWALTSVHVEKYPLTFWRCSKLAVAHLRDRYPLIVNMVHAKHTLALRWLQRLGFTLTPPEPFGVAGALHCKAILHTPKIEVIHV